MELSRDNAREIVREINNVLPQKVNIMNTEGIIIASTDIKRIGTFHAGAYKIIKENLAELRIFDTTSYEGAIPGTNFLLCVHDEPIGVLGITGDYEKILPLAKVIKKMTELMVTEQELQRQHAYIEDNRTRFITELLTHNEHFITQKIIDYGLTLNIDLTVPRRVLVVKILPTDNILPEKQREAEEKLKQKVLYLDSNGIVYKMTTFTVLLVKQRSNEQMLEFIYELKNTIEANYPLRLIVGADSPDIDYLHIQSAYLKAQKALQSCLRRKAKEIKFYDEINIEIFADEVSEISKLTYIHKIFKDYSRDELEKALHTLEVFYDENGSITKTAEKLFIHKNTLQQHLKKIAQRTGYDPRSLKSNFVFYIVIYFYYDLQNSGHYL